MNDDQAAEMNRNDGIDILVDLTGHMAGNRLLLFARKPAPVQVAYEGHPHTRGMRSIGWRLTDSLLDPPGEGGRFCTEEVLYLPRAIGSYDAPGDAPSVVPPPSLKNGYVTFGCLNRPAKLNPDLIRTWAGVLALVRSSKMVMS